MASCNVLCLYKHCSHIITTACRFLCLALPSKFCNIHSHACPSLQTVRAAAQPTQQYSSFLMPSLAKDQVTLDTHCAAISSPLFSRAVNSAARRCRKALSCERCSLACAHTALASSMSLNSDMSICRNSKAGRVQFTHSIVQLYVLEQRHVSLQKQSGWVV